MADICTAADDPCASGGHRTVTIPILGVPVTWRPCESELAAPFTDEERQLFASFLARARFQSGVPLAQFAGRVMRGDEATNVKVYTLFGPGVAVVKSSIGTSYSNILTEANGAPILVDFSGCTKMYPQLYGLLPGTGAQSYGIRIVRHSDDQVLYEAPSVGAQNNAERELDQGWVDLPAWAINAGEVFIRIQARGSVASLSPTFRCARLGVK